MPGQHGVLHPPLAGRVAIVTGASRGIGKALALRLALEGADVVVAAKSEVATERLPGSVHETAEAVRALGRRALAVPTDVRDEGAVQRLIARALAEWGRIDILINNAGALWLHPVLATPVKRFDLLMSVNVRAAYLTAFYALPAMRAQRWGHILNLCPAISTTPSPGKVAYMIAKMGMARLAIGIAMEHRGDNIAANALWPRTLIESQATIAHQIGDRSQWRTPEIVCDAVMAILGQEPPSFTGRQVLDEEVLWELAGMTSFDHYWCAGWPPAEPRYIDGSNPDFW
jgi:citronellol/citronellal dehydrogenase